MTKRADNGSRDGERPSIVHPSRRLFLLASMGFIAGCAQETVKSSSLPGPIWPDSDPAPPPPSERPVIMPSPPTSRTRPADARVITRGHWAKGGPDPSRMNRLGSVRYITVHHDGMQPFYDDSRAGSAARIELIRRAHRGRGWGDIGYHFVVDRSGRVWEGRPIAYQGAHVKYYNEKNIGIVVLGNFDEQTPNSAQIQAVTDRVSTLMRRYRVPTDRVRTHQEWAATACPGRNLQARMIELRRRGLA